MAGVGFRWQARGGFRPNEDLVIYDGVPRTFVIGEIVEKAWPRRRDSSRAVPAGPRLAGLPVGVEIDGPTGQDWHLLGVALTSEKILDPLPVPTGY